MVSLGANLVAPIFHGGALRANIDIRTAEQEQALADYGRVARAGEASRVLASEASLHNREPVLTSGSELARGQLAGVRLRVGWAIFAPAPAAAILYSARSAPRARAAPAAC